MLLKYLRDIYIPINMWWSNIRRCVLSDLMFSKILKDSFTICLLRESENHKTLIGKLIQLIMIKFNNSIKTIAKRNQPLFMRTNILCWTELSIILMAFHRVGKALIQRSFLNSFYYTFKNIDIKYSFRKIYGYLQRNQICWTYLIRIILHESPMGSNVFLD